MQLVFLLAILGAVSAPAFAQTNAEKARELAERGGPIAQSSLGFMYQTGDGVPQDFVEAMKWYRLAAAQGDSLAQGNIGYLYYRGQGVPKDYVRAHMWFNLAEASGEKPIFGSTRDSLAKIMTSAQIAQAQEMATGHPSTGSAIESRMPVRVRMRVHSKRCLQETLDFNASGAHCGADRGTTLECRQAQKTPASL